MIKMAYHAGLQPAALLALQDIVSLFLMWPLVLFGRVWSPIRSLPWKNLLLLGIVGNLGVSVCYFWAAQRMDISLLSMIIFSYPGFVLLYQIVMEKRRAKLREGLALLMALTGLVLAVNPFRTLTAWPDLIGLLLAIGGALTYAFMNVFGGKLTCELSVPLVTAISSTISTAGIVVLLPLNQWLPVGLTSEQVGLILLSGLLSTVLPMNLMYMGIRRIGVFRASVVSMIELPCTLLLAYQILQERLLPLQWLGALLILVSIGLLQWRDAAEPGRGSVTSRVADVPDVH